MRTDGTGGVGRKAHLAVVAGFARYRVRLDAQIHDNQFCIDSFGASVIETPCLVGNALTRAPLLAPLIFNGFSRKRKVKLQQMRCELLNKKT